MNNLNLNLSAIFINILKKIKKLKKKGGEIFFFSYVESNLHFNPADLVQVLWVKHSPIKKALMVQINK